MNRRLARITIGLAGLSLLGAGVYTYTRFGTFVYAGSYRGMPIHWWIPSGGAVILGVISVLAGLLLYALSRRPSEQVVRLTLATVAVLALAIFAVGASYMHSSKYYVIRMSVKTDAYILQVEAAKAIVRGENPYEARFTEALVKSLPPDHFTWIYRGDPPYTVDDIVGFVDRFDYLAPAALYYVPAVVLGIPPHLWDTLIASVGLTLVFARLPEDAKRVYPALLAAGIFIYIVPVMAKTTLSGWVVPLALAVVYLDKPLIAGPLLAWAGTYRIYPAFFILYLLIASHREGYDTRKTLAYAIITGLALNLPFLALNPHAYIESFLLPYKLSLNPLDMGPGLASLGHLGIIIPKTLSTVLVLAVLFGGLILAYIYYPRLKHAVFVLPALAMFFYYRPSYAYYLFFPWLGMLAYLSGRISYLDEPRSLPHGRGYALSALVVGSSFAASLEILDFVPKTEAQRLTITALALLIPLVAAFVRVRLRISPRMQAALLFSSIAILGIAAGLPRDTYYIVYDLGAARTAPLEAAGLVGREPLRIRAVVLDDLEPVIPEAAIKWAKPYIPPPLSIVPSLTLEAAGSIALPVVAAIAALAGIALAVILASKHRGGAILVPIIAVLPPIFLGNLGTGIQEDFAIIGLILVLSSLAARGSARILLALSGAVIVALSAPLGPLIALASLAGLAPGRKKAALLAVAAGALLSLALPHGYTTSYIYTDYCPLNGSSGEGALEALAGLGLSALDHLVGPLLWASATSWGAVISCDCSFHAVGALLYASLMWGVLGKLVLGEDVP